MILTFSLAALPLFGTEDFSIPLHIRMEELRRSQKPEIFGNYVLFSYWEPKPIRHVGIAFEHEGFRITHTFLKNSEGVFILPYPLPRNEAFLNYRIIVDGLWMDDPKAPSFKIDHYGQRISTLPLPYRDTRGEPAPRVLPDGKTTFVYYGPPGRSVYLAGSFNGWDPFLYPLSETAPGMYQVTLPLPPGDHLYAYFSDGLRLTDPLNPKKGFLPNGQEASLISLR